MKYDRMDLLKILNQCKLNNLGSEYSELEDIKDLLHEAFSICEDYFIDLGTYNYVSSTIEYLSNNGNKGFIDSKLINLLTYHMDPHNHHGTTLIDRLNVVFYPKEAYKESPRYFYECFNEIVDIIIWNYYDNEDFKYPKFDVLFKTIRMLDDNSQFRYIVDHNILVVLLSYGYLNNSFNYVYDFLNDKEYHKDTMNMNGIDIDYVAYNLEEVYKLLPSIFKSRSKIIK